MAEGVNGPCTGETLLDPCARKKMQQRKMTKDFYWILVCSVSCEVTVIAFSCLHVKAQLHLHSVNCHTHGKTVNCPASLRVLINVAIGFRNNRKSIYLLRSGYHIHM